MKLIVGLGNPGKTYDRTRHNAGFMVVDRLIQRHAPGAPVKARFSAAAVEAPIGGQSCLLLKPTTFMNRSGQSVADAVRFFKVDPALDLMVIVDDVALPSGTVRIRPGGGAGGHNGLSDIQRLLGVDTYPRCRVGIDATPSYMDQADYVLGKFTDDQWALVAPAIDKAADAVEAFAARGLEAAMNQFNAPPAPPRPRKERPPDTGPPKAPPAASPTKGPAPG
jgi:peptidyl-tRNA hydrolase, PTH1 family